MKEITRSFDGKVRKFGNSLCFTIPINTIESLNLSEGEVVQVTIKVSK